MARNNTLILQRNKEIRASFNRLKCEEQLVSYGGRRIAIRLQYQQILELLSQTYFLSRKRVEAILGLTEPKQAPIKSADVPAEVAL